MSAPVPAKSILKQTASRVLTATEGQKEKTEKDRKNLKIALKHAYLIQHRKDVEAAILNTIEVLIDFPAASSFTGQEARKFISAVQSLQPSDFDDLVEERLINGKCGYVLCANPPRSKALGASAAWKLKAGMGDWCSNDCAKKGLYIKAQLSPVPAWEREPAQQPDIQLHEDDRIPEDDTEVRRANRAARVDAWRQKVADQEDLAMERGEKTTSFRPKQVMADSIVEKKPSLGRPSAPELDAGDDLIEGHKPQATRKAQKKAPGDGDDDSEDDDAD